MITAIISTLFFWILSDSSEGPWFAAIASIYLGTFLVRMVARTAKVSTLSVRNAEHARRAFEAKIATAEDAAYGPLATAFFAGLAVRYAPLLPGDEWVHDVASYAAVFVCAALASGYFILAAGVDRAAEEGWAQK